MDSLKVYFRCIGASFRSQLQYKASFIMFMLANAGNTAIEFVAMYAFFQRFGRLGAWSLGEVALFYGMAHISFAICEGWMRGFLTLSRLVKQGELDRMLLRPRTVYSQVLGSSFQLMRLGRLSVGAFAVGYGYVTLGLSWSVAEWALCVFAILGGTLLYAGVITIQATVSFWTVESLELFNVLTYGGVETSQYPLDIYGGLLRRFFSTVMPLAAINYWPLCLLLGRDYISPVLSVLSPIIGPLFFGATLLAWRFGARHYRSTGS